MAKGSCLCGAVRVDVTAPLAQPTACHCTQCRRQSGHYWACAEVPRSALAFEGGDNLRWYQASPGVRRGFCATCGSFLVWDPIGRDTLSVAMDAFAAPTGVRLARHIFVADKGDYYEIADALPQGAR